MELQGLRSVIYPASDLDGARAWWTGVLGQDPYFVEPYYVGFEVAGYELGLLPDGDPSEGAHVYWGVEDVAATVAEAVEAGATVHSEPQDVGGGIVTALVANPDGGLVGFIYNPNFKT
jgi:catechol 2,3-dioxygenase-like lactoylglutathione lyase family enzyme